MLFAAKYLNDYLQKKFTFFLALNLIFISTNAQINILANKNKINTNSKQFVVSYEITLTENPNNNIAETYNGGIKTVFIKNNYARIRLVSLMRTQSIFFNTQKPNGNAIATVVKESGKVKTKMLLSPSKWKLYQQKNSKNTCVLYNADTLTILNLICKKAIITNADSSTLEVYYYPSKPNKTWVAAEPLFKSIPGIVLKYSIVKNNKTLQYTATKINTNTIAQGLFVIPNIGYTKVNFNNKKISTAPQVEVEETDDDTTEEAETELSDSIPTKPKISP